MSHKHRAVLASLVFFTVLLASPSFAVTLRPQAASRGMIAGSKSVNAAANVFFSGSFGYSLGGGQAVMKADTVTNPDGTASGPLRFSLWFTSAPYPSTGFSTASYDITPSLAGGQSVNGVNSAGTGVPFTVPPTGCYYVSLVLEENVSGTWTERDYGTFSRTFDIGNGCITSFTASPATVTSGAASTLSWTTTGASVTSVTIDNGVGSKPASGSATVNPTSTTTYTLSAFTTANASPPTKQVTVTVGAAPPPTATFSASPTAIIAGQSSTLTWTSANATSVSIDNGVGSQALNGSTSVSPASTTTYTLTATGPGGTTTKTATVTVTQPAPTATFSAAPASINSGQSSTLTWSTTNATSVSIDNGVGSKPASGSVSVSPSSTTTYTLTASGPGGTITRTATVTVAQPAPTISFSATPSNIAAGQSSSLVWSTTNATSVTIDNGVGSQPVSGSVSVNPLANTTYTLTATGPGGTLTSQATVTVSNRPSITFVASPTSVALGSSSTLTWLVANSTSVSIDNGIGAQAASGSMSVSPAQTTTYTLTATGPGGTSTASATVAIISVPTITFTASPTVISAGGSSTLAWAVTGVDFVTIDQGIGTVLAVSSTNVSPTHTTVYRLTATNAAGSASATATVTVGTPAPPKHRAVRH